MKRADSSNWTNVGIYSLPEAAHLLCTNAQSVRRWLLGYRFSLRDGRASASAPIFHPQLPQLDKKTTIGFLDLVELMFIKEFREQGLSLPYIRASAARAAQKWGTQHPFCLKRFSSDGFEIFETVRDELGDEQIQEVISKQYHFQAVLSPYLRQLQYNSSGDVERWWPLGKSRPVFLDPRIAFGKSVVSSVPTEAVYAAVKANDSEKTVAEWLGVSLQEVKAAVEFEETRAA